MKAVSAAESSNDLMIDLALLLGISKTPSPTKSLGLPELPSPDEAPLALDAEPGAYTHLMRWRHGVQPLTNEVLPIALRANTPSGGYAPEEDIFTLRIALLNAKQIPAGSGLSVDTVLKTETAQRVVSYRIFIETPFTRVAGRRSLAMISREPLPDVDVRAENRRGVTIRVVPVFTGVPPIDRVVLRRGPKNIQALSPASRIHDARIFEFPLSAFTPTGPAMTIVLESAASTPFEWPMHRRELEAMR